ncbi:DUF1707 domain-containing protein [Micromonospora citrea]|uniref:DUF1707 domain-containing protein n=1 Tax=Micromonospora citrea TaxID=47855 RepID=UPI000B893E3F|nr:DUF1707 domain-containing protein [Micromonospora citrea]
MGWISPNASCPVCGAAVYFYANEHGSRVFFDELGPPWPKHPCTDNPALHATTAGGRQAPSIRDLGVARRPSDMRDRAWKAYAVKGIAIEDGRSSIALQPLNGAGRGLSWTVSRPLSLRADDIVFVRAQQMSYFDADACEPAIVEDARRAAEIARRLITERDRQHVLAAIAGRVAAGEMTPDEVAEVTVAVRAARTRGELAAAIRIRVTDLTVAPPRRGDLWLLAIAFVLMVGATSAAEGGRSFLMMLPGLLLMATAVYRLNPDLERGARVVFAVLTAVVAICPAGALGGAIQVEILQR